jgi:hypothetical protein
MVRRWFAAIAEGELASDLWDADLIVDNIPEFPVTGPYRGYEGLRRWWDDLAEVAGPRSRGTVGVDGRRVDATSGRV